MALQRGTVSAHHLTGYKGGSTCQNWSHQLMEKSRGTRIQCSQLWSLPTPQLDALSELSWVTLHSETVYMIMK